MMICRSSSTCSSIILFATTFVLIILIFGSAACAFTSPFQKSSVRLLLRRPNVFRTIVVGGDLQLLISQKRRFDYDNNNRLLSFFRPNDGGLVTNRITTTASTTSTELFSSLSSITNNNVLHNDSSYVLTIILLLSTFGISLERRTVIGKALSAPLATMALSLTVANIGIVPFESIVYNVINKYAVALAVPMLLYDSNLRRVFTDTGTLLAAFGVGAIATVIGTIVAFPLVPMHGIEQSWKIACALAARHIGGAINFVAVAETLNIPGTAVSAAIAADNVVVALYFALLFTLAKEGGNNNEKITTNVDSNKTVTIESELDYSISQDSNDDDDVTINSKNDIDLSTISLSVSVASVLVTIGKILTKVILPTGTSALPLTSIITVTAATIFPKFFTRIRTAGTAIGILFIQMFFACSGAAGSIALVFQQAPALFAYSTLQIAIHFACLILFGRGIFKLDINELYLASNANVGGPTTAAAMAQAKKWKRLVLPALLVGILGYATATAIALALGPILVKLPILSIR